MRTGAARPGGPYHEVASTAPMPSSPPSSCRSPKRGHRRGRPVIIGYRRPGTRLVRSAHATVRRRFHRRQSLYATLGRAIATYRRLFEFHARHGLRADPGSPGTFHPGNGGGSRMGPLRIGVNTVRRDFPVWGRCLYDTATAPQAVLDVAEQTTPIVSPSGQRRASDRCQDALAFEPPLRTRSARAPRPLSSWSTVRRRCPARARADRPRPHPRCHAPRPADRRL
jgi:hypothetical protein